LASGGGRRGRRGPERYAHPPKEMSDMRLPSKNHRAFPITVLLCVAAAACTRDVTAPAARPGAPRFDVTASAAARYLVSMHAGAAADLASTVKGLGGQIVFASDAAGFAVVGGLSPSAAASLARSPRVSEVIPDEVVSLGAPRMPVVEAGVPIGARSAGNPAGAVYFGWQWNMQAIHAPAAWAAGQLGSPSVTVAIIDTGIDYDSYDLNGLVDLSRSRSFVASDDAITAAYFPTRNPVTDYDGHGTNVATQVSSQAAVFAGVTSRTTLIAVKVLDAQGVGDFGDILAGIIWAADEGANVANLSLGGAFAKAMNGRAVALLNQVAAYANRRGMLLVVSAGNEATDLDHIGNGYDIFCSTPNVVCVAAYGPTSAAGSPYAPAVYTNTGRSVIDVAGPGGNFGTDDLWPWGPDNVSWVWSLCSKTLLVLDAQGNIAGAPCLSGNYIIGAIGTSQATPHVSGLAALLIARTGSTNPAQIRHLIEQSADDLGQPGTDPFYGKGGIDVANALGS
jgi:lantibiotic leader peptide-processing serine protease